MALAMRLDPDTSVSSLLAAIPSSAAVFTQFGIALDGNERKTLGQICADHGIDFERFLRAMNEINWDRESPSARLNGVA
jgi:hypothetical protein